MTTDHSDETDRLAADRLDEAPTRTVNGPIAGTGGIIPDPGRAGELCVGDVIRDRFVLEARIGEGGMGVIFKARDRRKEEAMDRDPYVAIKVLGEDFKSHPEALIALQREAKKAQMLAHPNIVTVYDFDRDGDTVYMTMEWLDGEPLDRVLREHLDDPLPLELSRRLIEGMGKGLAYAHKRGIIHSDFKPGNVFVTRGLEAKILDFGIARAAAQAQPGADATVFDPGTLGAFTPAYASCEMLENGTPDPRDDIFALACVSYELLTGRHPFKRKMSTIARAAGWKPQPVPDLAASQWAALQRGLSLERARRTPSVQEFLDGLLVARTSERKRRWLPLLLGGGVLIAGAGASVWFLDPLGLLSTPPSQPQRLPAPSREPRTAASEASPNTPAAGGREPVAPSAPTPRVAAVSVDTPKVPDEAPVPPAAAPPPVDAGPGRVPQKEPVLPASAPAIPQPVKTGGPDRPQPVSKPAPPLPVPQLVTGGETSPPQAARGEGESPPPAPRPEDVAEMPAPADRPDAPESPPTPRLQGEDAQVETRLQAEAVEERLQEAQLQLQRGRGRNPRFLYDAHRAYLDALAIDSANATAVRGLMKAAPLMARDAARERSLRGWERWLEALDAILRVPAIRDNPRYLQSLDRMADDARQGLLDNIRVLADRSRQWDGSDAGGEVWSAISRSRELPLVREDSETLYQLDRLQQQVRPDSARDGLRSGW